MRQDDLDGVVGEHAPRTSLEPVAPPRSVGSQIRELEPVLVLRALPRLIVSEAVEDVGPIPQDGRVVDVVGVDADVGAGW